MSIPTGPTGVYFNRDGELFFNFDTHDKLKLLELVWTINPSELEKNGVLFFLYENLNRNGLEILKKLIVRQRQLRSTLCHQFFDDDGVCKIIRNYQTPINQLRLELYIFVLDIEPKRSLDIKFDDLFYTSIKFGSIPFIEALLDRMESKVIDVTWTKWCIISKIGRAVLETSSMDMLDFLISKGILAHSDLFLQCEDDITDQASTNIKYIMERCSEITPNTTIRYNTMVAPIWCVPIYANDLKWFDLMIEKGANLKVKSRNGIYFYTLFWLIKVIKDVRFYERFALYGININYSIKQAEKLYGVSRQPTIHLSRIHLTPREIWFTDDGYLRANPETMKRIEKFFHDIEVLLNIGYDPRLITSTDLTFQKFLNQNIEQSISFQSVILQTIRENHINIQILPKIVQMNNFELDFQKFRLVPEIE